MAIDVAKLVRQFIKLAEQKGFGQVEEDDVEDEEEESEGPASLEDLAHERIDKLQEKIGNRKVKAASLNWEYCEPGNATVTYCGHTYIHSIPADIMLVGKVVTRDRTFHFAVRFISHPFYQLAQRIERRKKAA